MKIPKDAESISVDELPAKWTSAHGRNSSSKMKNVRTFFDGFWFASGREAERWQELKLLQTGGYIKELQRQVPYPLTVHGVTIGKYIADFEYVIGKRLHVEDSKGVATALFKWKHKHFLAEYPGVVFIIS